MPLADPEMRRAYDRMRHQRDKEARNARNLAYKKRRRAEDPAFAEKERVRSRKTPRHVRRAHAAVQRALCRGIIVRPDICENCGRTAFIEAAHSDYSQPLLIHWLCRPCHRRWDRDEPKVVTA